MVGEGCEWKLDPKTGRGTCTGVYENRIAGAARFCVGSNGRLYLVTGTGMHEQVIYNIFERVGEGDYRKRGSIHGGGKDTPTTFWADRNGDQKPQDDEKAYLEGTTSASGYISIAMSISTDLTFYGNNSVMKAIQVRVKGFTECGAPIYDLSSIRKTPVWGMPSPDNRMLLSGNPVNGSHEAYDLQTNKLLWKYPCNWQGVHGSHRAPTPEAGVLRGTFSPCGSAKLPEPIGAIWALNSNVGEWHLLTGEGFYLTRLFQGDPTKVRFPDDATPGGILTSAPAGAGGEDFGGSLIQGKDGKVHVQAGKTGIWNVEVTGLESVKRLPIGTARVAIAQGDLAKAEAFRAEYLQARAGVKRLVVKRMSPEFTGDLKADFAGAKVLEYKKQPAAAAVSAAGWDDENLYLAWDVKDRTPWINAARRADQMYVGGDTVDFQLGADPKADKKRNKAVAGDLRLSIGNFQGKPTAVIYRLVSRDKKPATFSSGVVKEYEMDYVAVVEAAKVKVTVRERAGYVVEAAIPLSALGLKPSDGLKLRGDFGATHGGPGGQRTRLRTYWSNQNTGIVDDAVFELMMEPKNWGELVFRQ